MKLFKPECTPHNENYYVVRKMPSGRLVRYQLPCEGYYTEFEMNQIQDKVPGEWVEVPRSKIGFVFGLRMVFP